MAALIRLTITAGEATAEYLPAFLAVHVPHGWEEKSLPTGEIECIVHSGHAGFCAELEATLRAYLPDLSITVETVPEENWAEAWKEFFTPVEGGAHFLVLAPWMEAERAQTARIPIIIEPKMAFGTGHHATTALCLEAISELHDAGILKKGMRFADLGTGSGILGIACAKLGLVGDGLDIDVAAVDNACENRALNGVSPESFGIRRGGAEGLTGPYDLVLANILAAPLRELAPQIVAALAPRSYLVLSGLLDIQADGVESAYAALGLPKARRGARGEWTSLVFCRG